MTRKEAQAYALQKIDERIKEVGENGIAFGAPLRGKSQWTWKELREIAEKDSHEYGKNIIDDVLAMEQWKKDHDDTLIGHGVYTLG